jgi:hypothetical protein
LKVRRREFREESPIASLLERDRLGFGPYRKVAGRDPEKRRLLIELGLERIREAERSDYVLIGYRRRRLNG